MVGDMVALLEGRVVGKQCVVLLGWEGREHAGGAGGGESGAG